MKRTEETNRLNTAPGSFAKLLGIVLVLCATLCLGVPCEAAGRPSCAMPALTVPSPVLAAKFSFLDDIFGGFGKSGGKSYGYTHQGAQREERRGERGFFYYTFQTILRVSSGVFLAYHAGTLVEKLGRKARGMDTAAAIGGFVFSLIFPWIGLFIGGAFWGLWKLSEESGRTPPVR